MDEQALRDGAVTEDKIDRTLEKVERIITMVANNETEYAHYQMGVSGAITNMRQGETDILKQLDKMKILYGFRLKMKMEP